MRRVYRRAVNSPVVGRLLRIRRFPNKGTLIVLSIMLTRLFIPAVLVLLMAAPASASGGTPIPEASSVLLFALGLAGVLIGRSISARRRPDDDRHD